jgi:hypothetical protein
VSSTAEPEFTWIGDLHRSYQLLSHQLSLTGARSGEHEYASGLISRARPWQRSRKNEDQFGYFGDWPNGVRAPRLATGVHAPLRGGRQLPLDPADLERLAMAAYLLARDAEATTR